VVAFVPRQRFAVNGERDLRCLDNEKRSGNRIDGKIGFLQR